MISTKVAAAALLVAASGAAHAQTARPSGTSRTDLQRHDLSIAGEEVLQARVDFDKGSAFPRHTHSGEEIIYVLSGTLEYQLEGSPPAILRAGDVLFVPKGTIHAARNVGPRKAAELATFIVEKGKPLVEVAK